ncbi:unnamed protein product [Pseudo-nitzschia multistriata]|uniref:Cytochrome b561 domain-containing protein n=1 Tax=Pseudo-nitzschia multistriata TaxID=183589 RepID=A0A448ZKD2_9STRA|nr:unnamed protein product [Pseudo-nitzschia multistriata]
MGVAESQYTCQFSEEISIHKGGTTFLSNYVNEDEGTFTMRLRYTGGQAWVGIGVNTEGKGDMMPAHAVIGDVSRGVKRYSLINDDKKASGVIPLEDVNAHLKAGKFHQTDSESILEFTQDLVVREPGSSVVYHEISLSSVWIFAIGLPGNAWEGKHKVHGAFDGLELFKGCVKDTDPPTLPPTDMPANIPTNMPTLPPTEKLTFEANGVDYAINQEDPYGDEAYTFDGYNETFRNETFRNETFAKISFIESSSEATRGLWVAHGILMGLAWGILAPLAIGAAYLKKNLSVLSQDAHWLKVHFYLGVLVALFTFIGFILAIVATKKDDDLPHFKEDIHHELGLAIFILVLFQGLAGYIRPSPVPAAPKSTDDAEESSQVAGKKALYTRRVWEYTHRMLGIVLLGISWWNCQSGIVLQAEKYDQDDEQFMLKVFWGLSGAIAGSIFFVGYVLRLSTD